MQQNNLAGPSDQIEPEIELVSDDGKVEVIYRFIFLFKILPILERVTMPVDFIDQNMVGRFEFILFFVEIILLYS